MNVRMHLGIRGKIAAVILICMIPVLILGGLLFQSRNQGRLEIVQRGHRDLARAMAADVQMFLAGAVEGERTAGAAVTSQPYPVSGIIQLFTAIRAKNPSFLSLMLIDAAGTEVAASPPQPFTMNLADNPAVGPVRNGKEWAAGPPTWIDGHPTLEVATAIRDKEKLAAVVLGRLDLGGLRTVLPRGLGRAADGIILDTTGRLIIDIRQPARAPEALQGLSAVRTALAGLEATIEGYSDGRTGYLGAAAPIAGLGWAAIVVEPESSALESARRAAAQEMITVLTAVGVGLFLAWVLGAELSAPILALVRGARALGRGNLGTRVALRRSDELGELGNAFNEMSERLSRYVTEMNALQAVSDAALSTVRLGELLPPLVQRVGAALHADAGLIWFVEEGTGDLVVPAGFNGALAAKGRRLRREGAYSTMAVPLRVGGRVIGVVQVLSQRPREFTAHEVRLLETFADRVALAVDNARAYEREREIAGIIQQTLLPPRRVELPGLAVAGRYLPSREVGGDFYAVLPLDHGQVGLAIADVSGKGIPAATLSARARYLLEAFAQDGRRPEAVLSRLNHALAADTESKFVSLFYGILNPRDGTLLFASAGHLPPLMVRAADAGPRLLEAPGLLLGVEPGTTYAMSETRIGPGDLLLLFTDGITEARNAAGEQFGEQRISELLATLRDAPLDEVADRVMDAVASWSGNGPADDQTVVAARMTSLL
ncbi:MAG: HAMP domain-containing protein [Bacillati bacterium ANGP1]|uniref:HAMP domain-containing protein n=1 Tax=Candidatus Segetimicrobium genomatis TaxID=2569760 RepID=A0A537J8R2_9BACT|nr:MAG: HAMP domain-containing protein [Terrabacteria group bacterium ANGP1]